MCMWLFTSQFGVDVFLLGTRSIDPGLTFSLLNFLVQVMVQSVVSPKGVLWLLNSFTLFLPLISSNLPSITFVREARDGPCGAPTPGVVSECDYRHSSERTNSPTASQPVLSQVCHRCTPLAEGVQRFLNVSLRFSFPKRTLIALLMFL